MEKISLGISVQNISKTLGDKLIFRNFSMEVSAGEFWAILGKNGQGKSTLLKLICGMMSPDEGKILYTPSELNKDVFSFYRYFSASAPWINYDFALTTIECLEFLGNLKPYRKDVSYNEIISVGGLQPFLHVPLKGLSGGQMQRLKNALAFFQDTPLLLLDEPLSHLDEDGILLYQKMCKTLTDKRTVMVFSNHNEKEFFFCNKIHEF
ncbi:MAG: ATP-binding cassette domain-containing protein [Bacteroidia bacterium]|nr:ATP-binding cassette domain-containing protein [Bacteroidia bacterium]